MNMQDFLYKVTADGWVGFIGAIIGAVITALSILVAIQHNRKQIKQQNISMLIPYCEAMGQNFSRPHKPAYQRSPVPFHA